MTCPMPRGPGFFRTPPWDYGGRKLNNSRGGVKFPTGGESPRTLANRRSLGAVIVWADPVRFRSRRSKSGWERERTCPGRVVTSCNGTCLFVGLSSVGRPGWSTVGKRVALFTGIVEELGTVRERTDTDSGVRFTFHAPLVMDDAGLGDSIAVNGCCLTVTGLLAEEGTWTADAVQETLDRTNLRSLVVGDRVNFERPVRLHDRLGGHLVQGHVDAVGTIVHPAPNLQVRMAPELTRYVVEKGSITVDGCSLTVVKDLADGFTVAIIPHTLEATTLGRKGPGDLVNLEVDVMAKYAEKLLAGRL